MLIFIQIWHFKSKYWRIGALIKANYKQLKTILILGIRKLSLFFLALKLGEFSLFDNFFLDLANFWDLDNFSLFKFPNLDNFRFSENFPILNIFLHFPINLSSFLMLSILLAANILLAKSIYNDTIVFSIDVNSMAILLKL